MRYLASLLLAALLLSGCALLPPTWSLSRVDRSFLGGTGKVAVGELSQGRTLRQSFWPSEDGLHRVTLLFATYARANQGTVTFALLDDAGRVVYREARPARDFQDNLPHLYLFPPQPDSALRGYTIELRADSPPGEAITLWAEAGDRYPGLLHLDGAELAGDLTAEWGYKATPAVLAFHLVRALRHHTLSLLLTLLLWTLPGLALLCWLRRPQDEPWSVPYLWGSALALSGALLVILPQFTPFVRLGPWSVWALLAGSGALLVAAWQRGRSVGPVQRPGRATALYGALLTLVIGSRFLAIHPLVAPQWGDSVHHSLITQLLLDHGGIFATYEPYLPLAPFTYHAGFHLLCAWFGWAVLPTSAPLSGPTATLLGGQWQNVVAVVMVALLAEGLARREGQRGAEGAGVVALLVAGLLSSMPAFYLNWGRYTQLAGQIFLPPALLWSLEGWAPGQRRRWLLPTVLAVAGMALAHYRVLMMYAVALPLLLALPLWQGRRRWQPALRALLGRAGASGLATVALILPWYWKLGESAIVRRASQMVAAPARPQGFSAEYNAFGDVTVFVRPWLLWLAAAALLWLLLRRRAAGGWLGGWLLLLFLLSNPYLLRLPGTGLVNNFMLQIALYLPLATLVGVGVADAGAWLAARLPERGLALGAGVAMLGLAALGTWQQVGIADPLAFAMLTPSDERAARWIEANTPADALFHTNGFFAFADTVVAGSDGGWWLWLTAHRATTVPPMVYGHESGIDPGYRQAINDRFRRLQGAQGDPAALAAAMRAEGVDYLYIGAQQGRVGMPPAVQPLDPLLLRDSGAFDTLYTDDFAWVFRVRGAEGG